MDQIAKAIGEGFNAYHVLKRWFEKPETANIDKGYYVKCNKDAWQRGFNIAFWSDADRWTFLKRIEE